MSIFGYGLGCLAALGLVFLISLIPAALFFWAWNFALVPLFNVPHAGFWQAYAVFVILGIVGSAFRNAQSSGERS